MTPEEYTAAKDRLERAELLDRRIETLKQVLENIGETKAVRITAVTGTLCTPSRPTVQDMMDGIELKIAALKVEYEAL